MHVLCYRCSIYCSCCFLDGTCFVVLVLDSTYFVVVVLDCSCFAVVVAVLDCTCFVVVVAVLDSTLVVGILECLRGLFLCSGCVVKMKAGIPSLLYKQAFFQWDYKHAFFRCFTDRNSFIGVTYGSPKRQLRRVQHCRLGCTRGCSTAAWCGKQPSVCCMGAGARSRRA